jgi:hypothetical protein
VLDILNTSAIIHSSTTQQDTAMSSAMVTPEDYAFFDFLASYRWPNKTKRQIAAYRELVEHGDLQIETMLENALVQASGGAYIRTATVSEDFSDGGDGKKAVSLFRNNDIARDHWMNTFAISNVKNKTGLLRACCYSKQQKKFYFFAIPHNAYYGMKKIDIMLDNSTGYCEPQGIPKGKWSRYMVPSFERLATITEAEANQLTF